VTLSTFLQKTPCQVKWDEKAGEGTIETNVRGVISIFFFLLSRWL
jgi:hypothetical protein